MSYRFGVIALSMLLTAAGCGGSEPEPADSGEPLAVRTVVIEPVERPVRVEVIGTVRARNTAVVSSRVLGYIRRIHVDAGETVRRGQLLVELDDRELASGLAQADAGIAEVADAIAEASHGLEAARAELEVAELTHARFEDLLAKESVSRQEFDEVTARLRRARAAAAAAESRQRQAEAKQSGVEAQLAAARTARGYARITAPTDGLVTLRHLDPGSLAAPGTPILTLDAAGPLELEVAIPASRQGIVAVDQEVEVRIDGMDVGDGDRIVGRVSDVVPAVDRATRSFTVKIALPSLDDLRPGTFGRAILEGERRARLEVPADAVVERGQLQSVFVVEGAVARNRLVTLGEPVDGRYLVLSGLHAGDRVVVRPGPLTDGRAVRVEGGDGAAGSGGRR